MNQIGFLDSGVIRGLLIATLGLAGAIAGLFGINEQLFNEKGAHLVDMLSAFIAAAGLIYAAHQRATKPNPPITDGAAEKTAARIDSEKAVSSHWLVGILLFLVAIALTGCSGTRLFYKQAAAMGTPTAYPKAVLEHHNAIGRELVVLVKDPSVSTQSKEALKDVYRKTVCSASEISSGALTVDCHAGPSYQLDTAIKAYESVANAKTQEDLQAAVLQLTPLVTGLINLIAGVK
jgi:hypothetical protein